MTIYIKPARLMWILQAGFHLLAAVTIHYLVLLLWMKVLIWGMIGFSFVWIRLHRYHQVVSVHLAGQGQVLVCRSDFTLTQETMLSSIALRYIMVLVFAKETVIVLPDQMSRSQWKQCLRWVHQHQVA